MQPLEPLAAAGFTITHVNVAERGKSKRYRLFVRDNSDNLLFLR